MGLQAIDAPYGNFRDITGLQQSATQARALGCDGKWAVHPEQLEVIQQVFSPTTAEIELAQRILEAAKAAEKQGLGAVAVDGQMIDQATVQLARRALEQNCPLQGRRLEASLIFMEVIASSIKDSPYRKVQLKFLIDNGSDV